MTRSKSSKYKKKRTSKSQSPKSLMLTLGATAVLILGGGLAYFLFQNKGGDGSASRWQSSAAARHQL